MPSPIHIEGAWPEPMNIRRGWARATARPWNDDVPDIAMRLHRGGSEFLADASREIRRHREGRIFSPALYPEATRTWGNAGYRHFIHLEVMERSLGSPIEPASAGVRAVSPDYLGHLVRVDIEAFEGFWRMNVTGLEEAVAATSRSAILVTGDHDHITGYAIVGAQQSTSFLQRVAVLPDRAGAGLGTDLIHTSMQWAQRNGARTMVLNMRPENDRARRLYARSGFIATGTRLELLEFKG